MVAFIPAYDKNLITIIKETQSESLKLLLKFISMKIKLSKKVKAKVLAGIN